ncbi:MAG: Mur ligase domain-containing protein, partial [Brevibacterium aurantiacum]|nr:Mur ligase domain-containing protein [Brevibacterium aurantiacum]
MRISQLLPAAPGTVHGDPEREVGGVSHDSRTVSPGQLYAALPGANVHGAKFAPDLMERGITAILTDAAGWDMISAAVDPQTLAEVTGLIVEHPRSVLGFVSAAVYGTSVSPQLIGVTGT